MSHKRPAENDRPNNNKRPADNDRPDNNKRHQGPDRDRQGSYGVFITLQHDSNGTRPVVVPVEADWNIRPTGARADSPEERLSATMSTFSLSPTTDEYAFPSNTSAPASRRSAVPVPGSSSAAPLTQRASPLTQRSSPFTPSAATTLGRPPLAPAQPLSQGKPFAAASLARPVQWDARPTLPRQAYPPAPPQCVAPTPPAQSSPPITPSTASASPAAASLGAAGGKVAPTLAVKPSTPIRPLDIPSAVVPSAALLPVGAPSTMTPPATKLTASTSGLAATGSTGDPLAYTFVLEDPSTITPSKPAQAAAARPKQKATAAPLVATSSAVTPPVSTAPMARFSTAAPLIITPAATTPSGPAPVAVERANLKPAELIAPVKKEDGKHGKVHHQLYNGLKPKTQEKRVITVRFLNERLGPDFQDWFPEEKRLKGLPQDPLDWSGSLLKALRDLAAELESDTPAGRRQEAIDVMIEVSHDALLDSHGLVKVRDCLLEKKAAWEQQMQDAKRQRAADARTPASLFNSLLRTIAWLQRRPSRQKGKPRTRWRRVPRPCGSATSLA